MCPLRPLWGILVALAPPPSTIPSSGFTSLELIHASHAFISWVFFAKPWEVPLECYPIQNVSPEKVLETLFNPRIPHLPPEQGCGQRSATFFNQLSHTVLRLNDVHVEPISIPQAGPDGPSLAVHQSITTRVDSVYELICVFGRVKLVCS